MGLKIERRLNYNECDTCVFPDRIVEKTRKHVAGETNKKGLEGTVVITCSTQVVSADAVYTCDGGCGISCLADKVDKCPVLEAAWDGMNKK